MNVSCPNCILEFTDQSKLSLHLREDHELFTSTALSALLFKLHDDYEKYDKSQIYGDGAIAITAYLKDLLYKLK